MLVESPRPAPVAELGSRSLSEFAPLLSFRKGTVIGREGEPCTRLYLIARGQVMMSRQGSQGESYALYLLGPGDLFGEGSLRPRKRWLATARAVTDGSAHVLEAAHLPRLAQHYPELTAQIIALLASRLERAHQRMDVVQADSARERLVGLLSIMAEYHGQPQGDEIWLPLALTQAELGTMVGLARETVARVMATLEEEGLIRRANRRGLWIRREADLGRAD
jgi:CRP/FNR family transcriptional regulator